MFESVIVVGAGIAGLASAAALSGFSQRVILIERDPLPDHPTIRPGVSQGAHLHTLLKGGEIALDQLLPGFSSALSKHAVAIRSSEDVHSFVAGAWSPRIDLGIRYFSATRPMFEHVARQCLCAIPNVTILDRTAFLSARLDASQCIAGVIVGTEAGTQDLQCDLLVDCSGANSAVASWLAEAGYGNPPMTTVGIGMNYATGLFEQPSQWRGKPDTWVIRSTPRTPRGAVITPVEGARWIATLGSRFDDASPRTLEGFLNFATTLESPKGAEVLAGAELVGSIEVYRKRQATWRRYDLMPRQPLGLLQIGDTVASYNPIYSQGMSVAALQAAGLKQVLSSASVPRLRDGVFERTVRDMTHSHAAPVWHWGALHDLANPKVTGERPADFEQQLIRRDAVQRLIAKDPDLQKLNAEVMHLVRPATDLAELELRALEMDLAH